MAGFDFSAHIYITNTTAGGFLTSNGSFNLIARNIFSELSVTGKSNNISNNTLGRLNLSNACQNNISKNLVESSTKDYSLYITGNSSKNLIYDNILQNLDSEIVFNSHLAMNNTFYHNNFLTELHYETVCMNDQSLSNFWDNGKEGNYWADYNGTDSNGDGIGDTPYIIDANNIDHYPLMNPWSGDQNLPKSDFISLEVLTVVIVLFSTAVGIVIVLYFKRRSKARTE